MPEWTKKPGLGPDNTYDHLDIGHGLHIAVTYPYHAVEAPTVRLYHDDDVIVKQEFHADDRDDAKHGGAKIVLMACRKAARYRNQWLGIIQDAVLDLYPDIASALGIDKLPPLSDEAFASVGREWLIQQLIAAIPAHIETFIKTDDLKISARKDVDTAGYLPHDFFLPDPCDKAEYRTAAEHLAQQFLDLKDDSVPVNTTWRKAIQTVYDEKLRRFFAAGIANVKPEILTDNKFQRLMKERLLHIPEITNILAYLNNPDYDPAVFTEKLVSAGIAWDVLRRIYLVIIDHDWRIYINALLCDWSAD